LNLAFIFYDVGNAYDAFRADTFRVMRTFDDWLDVRCFIIVVDHQAVAASAANDPLFRRKSWTKAFRSFVSRHVSLTVLTKIPSADNRSADRESRQK
jgi:hypothetical protein